MSFTTPLNTQCPHCLKYATVNQMETHLNADIDGNWWIIHYNCPACEKKVIHIILMDNVSVGVLQPLPNDQYQKQNQLVYPKNINRSPIPNEVPKKYADDYKESCLVLCDSPKASAALSRRCLQSIIHDELNIDHNNLNREIDDVIKNNKLPSSILGLLHGLREFGNFGAHPTKDINSGEILEVELGEAEFCLSILETIFDHQFVQPAKAAVIKNDLNNKLIAAGKNPIK